MKKNREFEEFNNKLASDFERDPDYKDFLNDPKEFRSLKHVLALLRDVDHFENRAFDKNPIYIDLIEKKHDVDTIIEKVVQFQHGGLNLTVETMGDVVKSYTKGREEIKHLRESLAETKSILTSETKGKLTLRELWARKSELEESLRIIKNIEFIKDAPPKIQRLLAQRNYLAAIGILNDASGLMFSEDVVEVQGLSLVRDSILDMKEVIVDKLVSEIQDAVLGMAEIEAEQEPAADLDEEYNVDNIDDATSQGSRSDTSSVTGGDRLFDTISAFEGSTLGAAKQNNNPANRSNPFNKKENMNDYILPNNVDHKEINTIFVVDEYRYESSITTVDMPSQRNNNLTQKTGAAYLRLLVKCISLLKREDDYERLLLNNLSDKFRTKIIKFERQSAVSKLQESNRATDRPQTNNDTNGEGNDISKSKFGNKDEQQKLNTAIFNAYVSNLFLLSNNTVKRIIYTLKLLHYCRAMRLQTEHNDYLASQSVYQHDDESSDSDAEGATAAPNKNKTTKYKSPASDINPNSNNNESVVLYTMKEVNKQDIRAYWKDLEILLADELKLHLKEIDVENITDTHLQSRATAQDMRKSDDLEVDEDEDISHVLRTPIVPPTAMLVAPVYKKIVFLIHNISKYFVEEGLYDDSLNHNSFLKNSAADNTVPFPTYKLSGTNSKLTVLQQMAINEQKNAVKNVYNSLVMSYINNFIETEFLPITQSYVNSEMREIQLHSYLFNIIINNNSNNSASANNHENSSKSVIVTILNQKIYVSAAANKCSKICQSLYNYWYDIYNNIYNNYTHQAIIITIIDRLIRSFISALKEERDNLVYKCISYDDKYGAASLDQLTTDTLFWEYRKKLYHNKKSLEQIVKDKLRTHKQKLKIQDSEVLRNLSEDNTDSHNIALVSQHAANNKTANTSINSVSSLGGNVVSRDNVSFNMWALFFGSIGSSNNYPVTRDKMIREAAHFTTIASALQCTDWLSFELIKYCDFAVARLLKDDPSATILGGSGSSAGAGIVKSKHLYDSAVNIWSTTEAISKELCKTADTTLTILKNELQLICFFQLHQLANINSLKPFKNKPNSTSISQSQNVKSSRFSAAENAEADVVLSEFSEHLTMAINAMKLVLTRELLAVVIYPLSYLVPRILMRCIQSLISMPASAAAGARGNYNTAGTSSPSLPSLTGSGKNASGESMRFLRIVLSAQQILQSLIDNASCEVNFIRLFSDQLVEEIDRLRKYVKLLDLTPKDLKAYIKDNTTEFSALEFIGVWDTVTFRSDEKEQSFEDFWNSLSKSSIVSK